MKHYPISERELAKGLRFLKSQNALTDPCVIRIGERVLPPEPEVVAAAEAIYRGKAVV